MEEVDDRAELVALAPTPVQFASHATITQAHVHFFRQIITASKTLETLLVVFPPNAILKCALLRGGSFLVVMVVRCCASAPFTATFGRD